MMPRSPEERKLPEELRRLGLEEVERRLETSPLLAAGGGDGTTGQAGCCHHYDCKVWPPLPRPDDLCPHPR